MQIINNEGVESLSAEFEKPVVDWFNIELQSFL